MKKTRKKETRKEEGKTRRQKRKINKETVSAADKQRRTDGKQKASEKRVLRKCSKFKGTKVEREME